MNNPPVMDIALEHISFFIYPVFFLVMLLGILYLIIGVGTKTSRKFFLYPAAVLRIMAGCTCFAGLYTMSIAFLGGPEDFWQHCNAFPTWLFSLNRSLYNTTIICIIISPVIFIIARRFFDEIEEPSKETSENKIT